MGRWLRSAREQRGESLENVSAITRIGKSYLQAIEEDHLEKLPSPAYTKGFIRLYAKHLELSPEEAFLLIDNNSRQKPEGSESSIITPMTGDRAGKSAVSRSFRKWAISIFLLLTVSLFALLPALKQEKNKTPGLEQSPPLKNSTSVYTPLTATPHQQLPDAKPSDINADNPAAKEGLTAATGIILRLKAVQDGRIHITTDGAVSQEYDLKNGDIIEWKAEKMFLLELDNAGSVEGELNGTRMKAFGQPGKAAHLTIRADTIQ